MEQTTRNVLYRNIGTLAGGIIIAYVLVRFRTTATLGADVYRNIGTLAGTLLIAYVLVRSRTSSILRDELVTTRERCDRIEKENEGLKAEGHTKDVTIADLRARTDLESVKQQIATAHADVAKLITEGNLTIVGMVQTVSKDVMTGFRDHVTEEREFKQRISENLAQVSLVLDNLERRTQGQTPAPR